MESVESGGSSTKLGKAYVALPLMALLLISSLLIQRFIVGYGSVSTQGFRVVYPSIEMDAFYCNNTVYVYIHGEWNDTIYLLRLRVGNKTYTLGYSIGNDTVFAINGIYKKPFYVIATLEYRGYSFIKYSFVEKQCLFPANASIAYIGVGDGG